MSFVKFNNHFYLFLIIYILILMLNYLTFLQMRGQRIFVKILENIKKPLPSPNFANKSKAEKLFYRVLPCHFDIHMNKQIFYVFNNFPPTSILQISFP